MNPLLYFATLAAILVDVQAKSLADRYEAGKFQFFSKHHSFLCNGKNINMNAANFNETNRICNDKMPKKNLTESDLQNKPVGKDFLEYFHCHITCMLQELDLLEDGILVEAEIENFIKEAIPSNESAQLISNFKDCTKQFGNKIKLTGDCGNNELMQCIRKAYIKVCKVEELVKTCHQ